jgi:DNA primase
MSKRPFVDFRDIRSRITMEQVLSHYQLLDTFKRTGHSLNGPCPIHKGTNKTQFHVNTEKNIWNCFSECKHGGNTLDFICRMENLSIHDAAIKGTRSPSSRRRRWMWRLPTRQPSRRSNAAIRRYP